MDTINKDNPNLSEGSMSREPTVSPLVVNCLRKTLETIRQVEDMEGPLAINEEGGGDLTRRIRGTNIFGTDEVIVLTETVGTGERNGREVIEYTTIVSFYNNSPEPPLMMIVDNLSEGTFNLQVIKAKNVGFNQLVKLYREGGRISKVDIEEFEAVRTNKGVVIEQANCDKYLRLREGDQIPTELSRLINQISLPFSQRVKRIMVDKKNNL